MTDENGKPEQELTNWQLMLLSIANFVDAAGQVLEVKVDHVVEDMVYLAMNTPADVGEFLVETMLAGRTMKNEASNQRAIWTPENLSNPAS